LAESSKDPSGQVIIKFLREDEFPDNATAVADMNHEGQCLTLSAHANVLNKIDAGNNPNGRPYLVAEYLKGQSLKQLMSEGLIDPATLMNIIMPVTHALENMHKVGVLHLDLRPDKIIVEQPKKNPQVKLIGFGRAKFLPWAGREQAVQPIPKSGLYSLQYTSPEQAMDKRCLPASDVYSLGCIIYEGLVGRPAIQGENELHVMAQHLSGKIQAPSQVKGDALRKFDEVVMQALANETHRRFVDAAELREALQRVSPSQSGGWMARLFKK
jgi:serine/threonine-protein kinase